MKSANSEFALDRRRVRRAFDRAGASYDRAAVLQAEVRQQLLERLSYAKLNPRMVADVGCGTAHASRALKRMFPKARVIALDIALGMLQAARRQQGWRRRFERVCGDAARLPFADASVDLLYSNLMLQWCDDLDGVLREFRRVLKPQGLLSFSSFGPDTLKELRAAWAAADSYTHVSRFIDMHDVGDALLRAGLAEPVLDVEHYKLTYDSALALMRDLKAIGANNATAGRPPGLVGRSRLDAVTAAYERQRIDGRLPASYEVVFGQAWGQPAATGHAELGGEIRVPLSEIRRRE